MAERVVIVGAGPAGLATARAYRAAGGQGAVTLVGDEAAPPYRRPPLSKELLRGELSVSELPIEQEDWFDRNSIDSLRGCAVESIDPEGGTVALAGGAVLKADAIVLATGAEPVRPPIDGLDDPAVLTMRSATDSAALRGRAAGAERVLVLGTGFIGCEIAGSLALSGRRVTLIGEERLPQLARLGADVGARIARWLEGLGVELRLEATIEGVRDGRVVRLEGGEELEGSCVVLGMGVRPRGELAQQAGLPTRDGAVLVDSSMRCAQDGEASAGGAPSTAVAEHAPAAQALAVGDVALAFNEVARRRLRVEHWGDALRHGEVAGASLAGKDARWAEVPSFWSTIGRHTLKYAAWGDGHDDAAFVDHGDGAFTASYYAAGKLVGVLVHCRDEDYERGARLIAEEQQAG
ncbi:MAG: NAD(P)/FAD-dependent oxidoreductase [Solirubrobacteraceae bacterium]